MNDEPKPAKREDTPFVEGGIYWKMEQGGTERITATLVASKLPIRHGLPGKKTGRMVMASHVDDQVDEGGKLNQWTLEAVPVPVAKLAILDEVLDHLGVMHGRMSAFEQELASKRPAAPTAEVLERVAREAVASDMARLVQDLTSLNFRIGVIEGARSAASDALDESDDDSEEAEAEAVALRTGQPVPGADPMVALRNARARAAG